ncbi:MAG: ABC transporter ATP-binding protein [Clostridia bacterium]|nr:ABC transporter ATP-binding protein [Clostridia bacterium]
MNEYRTLWPFFLKYRKRYLIGILSLALADLLQLAPPKILGRLGDAYQNGSLAPPLLAWSALGILGVALGIAGFRYLWRLHISGTARLIETELRSQLFQHLQSLPPRFFDERPVGDLMAHATNDLTAVRMALGMGTVLIIDALLLTSATLAILLIVIDVRLTLVTLLPLPAMGAVVGYLGQRIHRRFRTVQAVFAQLAARAEQNVTRIRLVKAFGQEQAETQGFDELSLSYVQENLHLAKVHGLLFPSVDLLSGASLVIALGYGGPLVLGQAISLGDFVALVGYLALLVWPMIAMGWSINIFQRGAASLGRINALLAEEPGPAAGPAEGGRRLMGKIELKGLTFSYGGNASSPPALKDLHLVVEPGETMAIVGPSGSGKTTLANLLLRLYEPEEGQIFIDGAEIHALPLRSLRENIGYVPQESFLFSDTLAENIAFGRPDASREEIEAVARLACLEEDIASFSHGYETLVGERGVALSGGQRQRVALARALIRDPAILILDDSLSAVDAATEKQILENLRQFCRGRTTLIISHRLSAVRNSDLIVVLSHGKIVEMGNHQALMRQRGWYYRAYRHQLLEANLLRSGAKEEGESYGRGHP